MEGSLITDLNYGIVFFFSFFPYRFVAITNVYYDCQTQLNLLLTCRPYKLQGVLNMSS